MKIHQKAMALIMLITVISSDNIFGNDLQSSISKIKEYDKIFQTPFTLLPKMDCWPSTCLASEAQVQEVFINEWLPSFKNSLEESLIDELNNQVDDVIKNAASGEFDSLVKVENFSNMMLIKMLRRTENYYLIKLHFLERLKNLSMENICKDRCLGSFKYNIAHCAHILKESGLYLSSLSDELTEYAINSLANFETKKALERISWDY